MTTFYYKAGSWGEYDALIIDETTLDQAERGENYLDPDDFYFLCEAENIEAARELYWEEASRALRQLEMESAHP